MQSAGNRYQSQTLKTCSVWWVFLPAFPFSQHIHTSHSNALTLLSDSVSPCRGFVQQNKGRRNTQLFFKIDVKSLVDNVLSVGGGVETEGECTHSTEYDYTDPSTDTVHWLSSIGWVNCCYGFQVLGIYCQTNLFWSNYTLLSICIRWHSHFLFKWDYD